MRLRELRQKKGITLKQLSEISGVSIQQLSRYERGEISPSADPLTRIAKALDTSVDEILNGGKCDLQTVKSEKVNEYLPFDKLIEIIASQQELIKKLVERIR